MSKTALAILASKWQLKKEQQKLTIVGSLIIK